MKNQYFFTAIQNNDRTSMKIKEQEPAYPKRYKTI